jgi:hypothetical protein
MMPTTRRMRAKAASSPKRSEKCCEADQIGKENCHLPTFAFKSDCLSRHSPACYAA